MEGQVNRVSPASTQIALAEEVVTRYAWKALAGSVVGFSMDGFDMLILGFMLPTISAALALTSTQAGSLVTWTMLGAVAGGLIFGTLSDRITVLTWTILISPSSPVFVLWHEAIGTWSLTGPSLGLAWAASSVSAWRSQPRRGQPASAPVLPPTSCLAGMGEFSWLRLSRQCCSR